MYVMITFNTHGIFAEAFALHLGGWPQLPELQRGDRERGPGKRWMVMLSTIDLMENGWFISWKIPLK